MYKRQLLAIVTQVNQERVRRIGYPLLTEPASHARIEAQIKRRYGNPRDYAEQLLRFATEYPDDSDLAVQLLSNNLMGNPVVLSEQQETQLRAALSADHRLIIELLEKLVVGDLEAAREKDAVLARWPVDDAAYEWAVRLRLPWRLEAPPEQRVRRCNEAIEIIDHSAPFSNSAGLAFFRVSAAVRANRPDTALGTAASQAHLINHAIDEDDRANLASGISNLMRCYEILQDERFFRAASPVRYRTVLRAVEQAMLKAGIPRPGFYR